jgi:hypothetical protein
MTTKVANLVLYYALLASVGYCIYLYLSGYTLL